MEFFDMPLHIINSEINLYTRSKLLNERELVDLKKIVFNHVILDLKKQSPQNKATVHNLKKQNVLIDEELDVLRNLEFNYVRVVAGIVNGYVLRPKVSRLYRLRNFLISSDNNKDTELINRHFSIMTAVNKISNAAHVFPKKRSSYISKTNYRIDRLIIIRNNNLKHIAAITKREIPDKLLESFNNKISMITHQSSIINDLTKKKEIRMEKIDKIYQEEYKLAGPDICAICTDENDKLVKISCGHLFHIECITDLISNDIKANWDAYKSKCPLCRQTLCNI